MVKAIDGDGPPSSGGSNDIRDETVGRIPSRRGVGAFLRTGYCSQALFRTLNRAFGDPLEEEERASVPLAGGITGHGHQCGMVWGAALGAGAQAYRRFGPGPLSQTKAIVAAQRVVESFLAEKGTIECSEITNLEWGRDSTAQTIGFLLTGGPVRCFRMAGRYPSSAFNEINAVLSEDHEEPLSAPVGCAALVAVSMGFSERHAVTVAGLAGGIGLSGSACGALGAAIWFMGLEQLRRGAKKISYKPAEVEEAVERFLACTGGEFSCSKIVGRSFEGVADHADYVARGGCAKIIESLMAE